jgi:putative peptidoglycan lipid II flippase
MLQSDAAVTVFVSRYDEGLAFFLDVFGFPVLEDAPLSPAKRWVVTASSTCTGSATIVLAVPSGSIRGPVLATKLTGGSAFSFTLTIFGDITRICRRSGVRFLENARREIYGLVAVFVDPWGGKWDLLQPTAGASEAP